ncbi:hypothetical protein Tco_0879778 [Tanacetum coccineum]|uniref:Uncharacterized protein n=1 Tax=Tanacetum coccineum TaxID=301880 RepID=A0ABQ5CKN3_9ASTR
MQGILQPAPGAQKWDHRLARRLGSLDFERTMHRQMPVEVGHSELRMMGWAWHMGGVDHSMGGSSDECVAVGAGELTEGGRGSQRRPIERGVVPQVTGGREYHAARRGRPILLRLGRPGCAAGRAGGSGWMIVKLQWIAVLGVLGARGWGLGLGLDRRNGGAQGCWYYSGPTGCRLIGWGIGHGGNLEKGVKWGCRALLRSGGVGLVWGGKGGWGQLGQGFRVGVRCDGAVGIRCGSQCSGVVGNTRGLRPRGIGGELWRSLIPDLVPREWKGAMFIAALGPGAGGWLSLPRLRAGP